MARFVFRNATVKLGDIDVSGDLNEVTVSYALESNTVFGAGSHSHVAGGVDLDMKGLVRVSRGIFKPFTASKVTVFVSQRAGRPLVFEALTAVYRPGDVTGQLLSYTVQARDGTIRKQ